MDGNICKTCKRVIVGPMVPINSSNLREQIRQCLPDLQLENTSDSKLCQSCAMALQLSYRFKGMCNNAEKKHRQEIAQNTPQIIENVDKDDCDANPTAAEIVVDTSSDSSVFKEAICSNKVEVLVNSYRLNGFSSSAKVVVEKLQTCNTLDKVTLPEKGVKTKKRFKFHRKKRRKVIGQYKFVHKTGEDDILDNVTSVVAFQKTHGSTDTPTLQNLTVIKLNSTPVHKSPVIQKTPEKVAEVANVKQTPKETIVLEANALKAFGVVPISGSNITNVIESPKLKQHKDKPTKTVPIAQTNINQDSEKKLQTKLDVLENSDVHIGNIKTPLQGIPSNPDLLISFKRGSPSRSSKHGIKVHSQKILINKPFTTDTQTKQKPQVSTENTHEHQTLSDDLSDAIASLLETPEYRKLLQLQTKAMDNPIVQKLQELHTTFQMPNNPSKMCSNKKNSVKLLSNKLKMQVSDSSASASPKKNVPIQNTNMHAVAVQNQHSCTYCGKMFKYVSQLEFHTRKHTTRKDFTCDLCGRSFILEAALLVHFKKHVSAGVHQCDVCERYLSSSHGLKRHKNLHSGRAPKEYKCYICRMKFNTKSYISSHMLVHTGEKPFTCDLYRKTIRLLERYSCGECHAIFDDRDGLKHHWNGDIYLI